MWRAVLFLVAVTAAAFLCLFVIRQHGLVSMTLGDKVYETSLATALGALIVAILVLYLIVRLLLVVLRTPLAALNLSRSRRKAKGTAAISNGLIAAAAGDLHAAARHARVAERFAGHEPLALLLKAQAAQLHGKRAEAKDAFTRMTELTHTRGLGLRGLFLEARRGGDAEAARGHAAQAARLDVFLPWAHEATLTAQCQARDWLAALATLERNHRLGAMDAGEMRHAKAALLAARARDLRPSRPDDALAAARKALAIEPGLTPAAVTGARLLAAAGQERKAARVIEAAWRVAPHPDLAETYVELRGRPKASERLRLALKLTGPSPGHEEGRVALARASLAARDFARAHAALAPLAAGRPTARICLLMAEIEEAENGMTGLAREWLARAAHAPRDPAWIADGVASPQWEPVAPSGRIGAFAWEHPPELPGEDAAVPAPAQAPVVSAASVLEALPPPAAEARAAVPTAEAAPMPEAGPSVAVAEIHPPAAKPIEVASVVSPDKLDGPRKPPEAASAEARIEAVAFPLGHAPDDPGAEPPVAEKGLWRKLTG